MNRLAPERSWLVRSEAALAAERGVVELAPLGVRFRCKITHVLQGELLGHSASDRLVACKAACHTLPAFLTAAQ